MTTSSGKGKAAAKRTGSTARPSAGAVDEDIGLDAFSDKLLADLDQADLPAVRELHQMSRSLRATLINQVQNLLPLAGALETALKTGKSEAMNAGQIATLLADVEDVLATIAVEPERFRAWALEANDMQLLGLFARFVQSFQSGEASSSSR